MLLLTLVLLSLGAWALWSFQQNDENVRPTADGILEASPPGSSISGQPEARSLKPQEAIERIPVAVGEKKPAQADSSKHGLLILNGLTQQPVIDAEVLEIHRSWEDASFLLYQHASLDSDWFRLDPSHLIQHRSDENGWVSITRLGSSAHFVARKKGFVGSGFFVWSRAENPAVMELWPDSSWQVQTIGSNGKPKAKIAVGVQEWRDRSFEHPFISRAVTQSNGIAELSHTYSINHGWKLEGKRFRVSPAIPLKENVSIEVDLEHPPAVPIQLRLPPTAGMDVLVLEADGTPLHGGFGLSLMVDTNPISGRSQEEIDRLAHAGNAFQFERAGFDGKSRFEAVGLGLDFLIHVNPYVSDSFYAMAKGPTHPGEDFVLTVQRPAPRGFKMRLVDSHGSPLAQGSCWIQIDLEREGEDSSLGLGRGPDIDQEGFVRIILDEDEIDFLEGAQSAFFTLEARTGDPVSVYEAKGNLPTSALHEIKNLPDLEVRLLPILAQGKFLYPDGTPARSVFCSLETVTIEDGKEEWDWAASGYSDKSGVFRLMGNPPRGPTRFTAFKRGYLPIELARTPAENAVFTLDKGARIRGTWKLPTGLDTFPISILIKPSSGDEGSWKSPNAQKLGASNFELQAMTEQMVDVGLAARLGKVILAQVPQVSPWVDETHADRRLSPISIRNPLHSFQLELIDAKQNPVHGAEIQLLDTSFEHQKEPFRVAWDCNLVLPVSSSIIRITAPNFRSREVEIRAGKQEVVLEPGFQAFFPIHDLPTLEEGSRLAIWVDPKYSFLSQVDATFSPAQTIQFTFAESGLHRMVIHIIPPGKSPGEITDQFFIDFEFMLLNQSEAQAILAEVSDH
ncbi:MAG: hypothetical protein QM477_06005 [Planctomycetota bacterium]